VVKDLSKASLLRVFLLRVLTVVTVGLGCNYIIWRWFFSLNLNRWWIALPLVIAETYSLVDVALFGLTMWRSQERMPPPPAKPGLTVDVFITTYNESVELVRKTSIAARAISYPHKTWILDDGGRPAMRELAAQIDVGYITRSEDWKNRPRHAKAGNLNNALMATDGEFLLVLDSDQVPNPEILDHVLGYFEDEKVAFVQTPQVFENVTSGDPLGSQAPLFYGPIQQGKDGWNSAFFCGSNAVLRREALMQLGVTYYVKDLERAVKKAIRGADRLVAKARRADRSQNPEVQMALDEITAAVKKARASMADGAPIANVTYELQQHLASVARDMVTADLQLLSDDIKAIAALEDEPDGSLHDFIDVKKSVAALAHRDLSPLGAIESIQELLNSLDVDRSDEAQPIMPLATISVTEDMATAMRLHSMGWRSVYHHETLVLGLAPEDLRSMLTQRLRWAQGTMQVMFKANPLLQKGLTFAQRLMYFATTWSYLSGFAALAFIAAPVVFLCFGILPVRSTALVYFLHFLPFMVANQLLFLVASRGMTTWRGQQYSLALFPVWIKATTSAASSVILRRGLNFAVTPKDRQEGARPWGLVSVQMASAALLIFSSVVGITRLVMGLGEPIGTSINLAWVILNLAYFSVLVQAVLYQGYRPKEKAR
jgi:cellulose synthase (UDP-forming)